MTYKIYNSRKEGIFALFFVFALFRRIGVEKLVVELECYKNRVVVGAFNVASSISDRDKIFALIESVVYVEEEAIAVVCDNRSGGDFTVDRFHFVTGDSANGVTIRDVVEVA